MHHSPFTNDSWVSKYGGTECYSTDIYDSNTSPLNNTGSSTIATCDVHIQTEECFFEGDLVQIIIDSRDQLHKTLPPPIILPLKKRNIKFEENCETEPSEKFPRICSNNGSLDCPSLHSLQIKHPEFNQESDDQHFNRSHEQHKPGKLNAQETPTNSNHHCSKQGSADTIEKPLDLSVNGMRTKIHKNDQKTSLRLDLPSTGSDLFSNSVDAPQNSIRSVVEINGSQNDEKMQQEDSLSQQTSTDKQQKVSKYPLLDDSQHKAETHTTSVELPVLKQKELEELEVSIAIDSVISNSSSNHSESDLKCGKPQENDAEVLETSSADNMAEKHVHFSLQPSAADSDSLKKYIDDGLEGKEKCCVEEMQTGIEKTNTEYMALEETLQPVFRVRNLRRQKRSVTVDHFSLSFTRLPREEQMRINPERAMKLREENNRACRKNRLKRAQKMMELEKELTRFKEIARRSNAAVKC